jgi:hypothetical protein
MKGDPFFLLLFFVSLMGCVSPPPETEEHSPSLMIAQNSNGEVSLVWDSDSRYLYTIYHKDASREWRKMRSVNRVRGTGGTMKAIDHVNPHKTLRRYRLYPEKPGG